MKFYYLTHKDAFRSEVGGQTYSHRDIVLLCLAGVKFTIIW